MERVTPYCVKFLAAEFAESLRRGSPLVEALHTVGEPDPEAAAEAFRQAAAEPSLAASSGVWGPALLRSALPGAGARRLLEISRVRRKSGQQLDPAKAPSLPLVLGSSDFLARKLAQRPNWIEDLEAPVLRRPASERPAADWDSIREAKYRGLLRVVARDLTGHPFAESLRDLSDLADHCLHAALDCTARETGIEPPALFAVGKLGGRELNFSSDVDLLFFHRVPDGEDPLERNRAIVNFIRHFKKQLEMPSRDGFIYRVDLDLRPEGRAGALTNSIDSALAYYETLGAEWERQMLIRLRVLAGDPVVTRAFSNGIEPFIYRRSIDPSILQAVREMKDRVEQERRDARRDLENDLKEGPGGIRDVEFLVQSLQLLLGGRSPEIRTGNTLDGLRELGRLELLPESTTTALAEAYTWLRRAEHAQQWVEEQQTAQFPRDPDSQRRLARRMGYDDVRGAAARSRLLDDLTTVRSEVRFHFDALVLRAQT